MYSNISPLRVSVIGGGSFGTVLANISAERLNKTRLWLRDKEQLCRINNTRYNHKYMPGLKLNSGLEVTDDLQYTVTEAQLLIIAVPSKAFGNILKKIMPYISNQYIVTATKGIAPDNFSLMSELIAQELKVKGLNPDKYIGVLSGPNIASEIAAKHLTGSVIATCNNELSDMVSKAITTKYFHIFQNNDLYGVEIAGALKNIYAIAAGISDSLGFGINTKSVLITRSAAEIARFAVKMKANHLTFLGLAGMGDLITTCFSPDSRNYRLGKALISGESLDKICNELGGVAEGINTTNMVYKKASELKISMPLMEGIYRILFRSERIKHVLWRTLRNTPREDVEYLSSYKQQ